MIVTKFMDWSTFIIYIVIILFLMEKNSEKKWKKLYYVFLMKYILSWNLCVNQTSVFYFFIAANLNKDLKSDGVKSRKVKESIRMILKIRNISRSKLRSNLWFLNFNLRFAALRKFKNSKNSPHQNAFPLFHEISIRCKRFACNFWNQNIIRVFANA